MIENAAQGVIGVVVCCGVFDRLADGDAETPPGRRIFCEDGPSGVGIIARARHDLTSPCANHGAPVWFLFIADAYHVDLQLKTEHCASKAQSASPLSRAGLGCQPLDAGDLVVVCLCQGGVELVTSGGTDSFVLVIDFGRRVKCAFKLRCANERRRSECSVRRPYFIGDFNETLLAHFLHNQLHGKERSKVLRSQGLLRSRVERWFKRRRQVRKNIVIVSGDFPLFECECALHNSLHRMCD